MRRRCKLRAGLCASRAVWLERVELLMLLVVLPFNTFWTSFSWAFWPVVNHDTMTVLRAVDAAADACFFVFGLQRVVERLRLAAEAAEAVEAAEAAGAARSKHDTLLAECDGDKEVVTALDPGRGNLSPRTRAVLECALVIVLAAPCQYLQTIKGWSVEYRYRVGSLGLLKLARVWSVWKAMQKHRWRLTEAWGREEGTLARAAGDSGGALDDSVMFSARDSCGGPLRESSPSIASSSLRNLDVAESRNPGRKTASSSSSRPRVSSSRIEECDGSSDEVDDGSRATATFTEHEVEPATPPTPAAPTPAARLRGKQHNNPKLDMMPRTRSEGAPSLRQLRSVDSVASIWQRAAVRKSSVDIDARRGSSGGTMQALTTTTSQVLAAWLRRNYSVRHVQVRVRLLSALPIKLHACKNYSFPS